MSCQITSETKDGVTIVRVVGSVVDDPHQPGKNQGNCLRFKISADGVKVDLIDEHGNTARTLDPGYSGFIAEMPPR